MELEKIKLNLKGVIGSSKDGILVNNLENEYKKIINCPLNYKIYNQSLLGFLNSMNDVVRLHYTNHGCYVHLYTNENAPQCLKKLCNLIQTTKTKKSGKKRSNIPNNIMSKASGFNNLKISVPNDLWATNHETNGNRFDMHSNTNSNNNNFSMGFKFDVSRNRDNNSYSQNDNFKIHTDVNSSVDKTLKEQSLNSSNLQPKQNNYPNGNYTPAHSLLTNCSQTLNKVPYEKSFTTDNYSSQNDSFRAPNMTDSLNSSNLQSKPNDYQNENNIHAYSLLSNRIQAPNELPYEKSITADNYSSQNDSFKAPNMANSLNSSNLQSKPNNYQNENNKHAYSLLYNRTQTQKKLPHEKSFTVDNSCSQNDNFKVPNNINIHEHSLQSKYVHKPNKLPDEKSFATNTKVVSNESFQSISTPYSISSSSTNSLDIISNKSFNNMDTYHHNETTSTINTSKEESFIIDWPINMDISIDILHKPVKILGIQSGYALLTIANTLSKSAYIPSNTIFSVFPGDVFLWQPPIPDPNRLKSMIDISNAIPIIAIEQINDTMKVRVMGLKVLLTVNIRDIFEFPNNISNFKKFLSEFEMRKLTFTRLAMIPKIVSYYNVDIMSDLYFSPDSVNDNEYIFERCEKRGDFLNIFLLIRYFYSDLRQLNSSEQNLFSNNLNFAIKTAKSAVCSQFREMLTERSINKSSDCDLFLPIEHNRTSLINRMLIGCERIFSVHYASNESELKLERMIYNNQTNSFHYFDDNNLQATVPPLPHFKGIYRINEEFVTSRLSNISKLRFLSALLIHIPPISKFNNFAHKN